MAVDVLSCNLLDAFSDESRARAVIDHVGRIDPDVAVFPEAHRPGEEQHLDNAQDDLTRLGYDVLSAAYDDEDGRKDAHGLMMIARNRIHLPDRARTLRLAGRTAFMMTVVDGQTEGEIDATGAHFDDRTPARRVRQAEDYTGSMDFERANLLAGDLNDIPAHLAMARLLRLLRPAFEQLPVIDPGETAEYDGLLPGRLYAILGRIGSLGTRLSGMARGEALAVLAQHGFQGTDRRHRPTMPDALPFAQLDHVMINGRLRTLGHTVTSLRMPDGSRLTDHRAVTSRVEATTD